MIWDYQIHNWAVFTNPGWWMISSGVILTKMYWGMITIHGRSLSTSPELVEGEDLQVAGTNHGKACNRIFRESVFQTHGCRERKTPHRERFAKEMAKGLRQNRTQIIGVSATALLSFQTSQSDPIYWKHTHSRYVYIYICDDQWYTRSPPLFFPLQDMVAPETAKSGRLHPQNFQNSLVELWFRLTLSLVSPIIIHITVIVTNRTVLIKHHIDAWTSIEPLSTTVIKNH